MISGGRQRLLSVRQRAAHAVTTDEGEAKGLDAYEGTGSSISSQFHVLTENEWRTLRNIRLCALKDSPKNFLSTYEKEVVYQEAQWRREFSRGEWLVVAQPGNLVSGLIGAVHDDNIPSDGRYLEYLWVSPKLRRSGLATSLIRAALERLSASGIATAWLWILDGNEPARKLYEGCGFISTGERQPLKANPSRFEERMRLRLK